MTDAATVPADSLCPRCQKPLADPKGLGWCQSCGYCRSLEEDRARLPLESAAEPKPALAPPRTRSTDFPVWAVGLVLVMLVAAGGSWAVSHYLALKPLPRALWTSIQIVTGVVIMLVGQGYALYRIAPEEGTLHIIDAIIPFRLYGLLFKRLPRMWQALYLGSWGLCLVLSALIFIGGLGYWLTYLPKSNNHSYMPDR
jgi:hypothetical protein